MSKIEWTEQTWNPIVGCTQVLNGDPVLSGCLHCYAMNQAYRNQAMGLRSYQGVALKTSLGEIVWTGKVNLVPEALAKPLRRRKPTMWFVNSMSDLFHESVPFEWVDLIFGIMALCPQHNFQILTKRSLRMLEWSEQTCRADWCNAIIHHAWKYVDDLVGGTINLDTAIRQPGFPLPNCWLGVSVESQAAADERVPLLLSTPASKRFLSCEPLLAPVDLTAHAAFKEGIDWVIVGGESGYNARLCSPDWVRSIVSQCKTFGVPVFVKQLGSDWAKQNGTHRSDTKGADPDLWTEDLRVRDFPDESDRPCASSQELKLV
jgi:protein gp37